MTTARTLNLVLAVVGSLTGLSGFLIEDFDKALAMIVAVVSLAVFLDWTRDKSDAAFNTVVELLRYACIAWIVAVGLQQIARSEVRSNGAQATRTAVLDLRDEFAGGRSEARIAVKVPRGEHFAEHSSYVVEAVESEWVVSAPLPLVLARIERVQGTRAETALAVVGIVLLVAAGLLRAVEMVIAKLGALQPGGNLG